jgi:hypothetical protein
MAKHFNNLNKIQKYRTENTLNFDDEEIKIVNFFLLQQFI